MGLVGSGERAGWGMGRVGMALGGELTGTQRECLIVGMGMLGRGLGSCRLLMARR